MGSSELVEALQVLQPFVYGGLFLVALFQWRHRPVRASEASSSIPTWSTPSWRSKNSWLPLRSVPPRRSLGAFADPQRDDAWIGRRASGKREAQAGPGPLVAGHLADDPRISSIPLPREVYPLAVTNKRPRTSQARRQVVDATEAELDVNELLFGSADDNHLAQRQLTDRAQSALNLVKPLPQVDGFVFQRHVSPTVPAAPARETVCFATARVTGLNWTAEAGPVRRYLSRLHARFAVTIIFATVSGLRPSRSAISFSVFLPVMWRASARFCWDSVHDSAGCSGRRRHVAAEPASRAISLGPRGRAWEMEETRRAS